jgi:di/tricarboxylate transporter
MTSEIILLVLILITSILLFVTGIIRMDLTALLALIALTLTGLVNPEQALSGFSNPAVITVWAMFILSAGLARTGISSLIGTQLLKLARESGGRLIAILMTVTALLSSIMNNIGVAAMFLPITLEIARRTKRPPSLLLLPMAYGSLLGGLILLIGTASNLVVRDAMSASGFTPLGLFDFVPGGLVIMVISVLYMTLIGRHFLPVRKTPRALSADDSVDIGSNQTHYALEERLANLVLPDDSALAGKTLVESRIGRALGLNVLSIQHKNGRQSPPEPNTVLDGGDRLLVLGRLDQIDEVSQRPMFIIDPTIPPPQSLLTGDAGLAEFEISAESPFKGKTLSEISMRRNYDVTVLAIRQDEMIRQTNLQDLTLNPGDRLLIQGLVQYIGALKSQPGFRWLTLKDTADYHLDERLLSIHIPENSSLIGRNLTETRLGAAYGLAVLRVKRHEQDWQMPKPDMLLQAGDKLVVDGRPLDIEVIKGLQSLKVERKVNVDLQRLTTGPLQIVEVMLSPFSALAGKNLRELHFREKYGVSVLAIFRGERSFRSNLGELPLQYGDALLCYGEREKLKILARERDFVVLRMDMQEVPRLKKAPLAALIMAAVIFSVILFDLPIAIAAIAGCTLMVLGGALTMDEAYQSIDWRSIFLIAAMLPLGIAIQQTGTAALLGEMVIKPASTYGPSAILAGLMLLCMTATLVMPSPVVAVIMSPIALNAAINLGISPYAFLLGVAYAIAASFLSPVAIPVNTLIISPGGYRYSDFIKHGLPISLIVLVVSVFLLPILFPYY